METPATLALLALLAVETTAILVLLLGVRRRALSPPAGLAEAVAEIRNLAGDDRAAEARLLAELPGQVEAWIGASVEPLRADLKSLGAPRDDELARIENEGVARIEAALSGRIDGLETVVRELGVAVSAAREDSVAPPPGAAFGALVREVVEPLTARAARIEDALEPVATRLAAIEVALRDGRVEGVEDALVRVLKDRGFRDVVLLEGPAPDGERSRILVEARRDGMAYKGPVFLVGGKVVEQRLNPSFPMFP